MTQLQPSTLTVVRMNAADPNNDHHHPNSVGHTAGAYGGVDRDPGNGPSRSERGSRARATFEAFKQWRHDRNNVTHAKGAGAGKGGAGGEASVVAALASPAVLNGTT